MPHYHWLPALALAAGLASTGAIAQTPATQTAGAVQYRCGGIGVDESSAMRAAMKDYPLSLLFAQRDGAYLANVAVEVGSGEGISRFGAFAGKLGGEFSFTGLLGFLP